MEVTEEGTEAAAVTTIGFETTSLPVNPYFIVNKPFVFVIREKSSGVILFMGNREMWENFINEICFFFNSNRLIISFSKMKNPIILLVCISLLISCDNTNPLPDGTADPINLTAVQKQRVAQDKMNLPLI